MCRRLTWMLTLALGLAVSAIVGCGSSGGGDPAPVELSAASGTSFTGDGRAAFAASDWGFPSDAVNWYREHETHDKKSGAHEEVTKLQQRTSQPGTPSGSTIAGVLTTSDTYAEDGTLTG